MYQKFWISKLKIANYSKETTENEKKVLDFWFYFQKNENFYKRDKYSVT
jgi:hypothetical protein